MAEMIEFNTSRFGTIEISADKTITFPNGIPGFEELKSYILLDYDAEGLFKWLQSTKDPEIAFLLTIPGIFKPDYKLPEKGVKLDSLSITADDNLVIMVMVCVPGGGAGEKPYITLNLKGPIVFNESNMTAMQCIVESNDYACDYKVELSKKDEDCGSAEVETKAP